MGADLNADVRAAHGVSRKVLDAERTKVIAEIAELERDRDERLADVAPGILRDLRRKREELARLDSRVAEAAQGPKRIGELLDGAFARLLARARGQEPPVRIPWSELAAALGGGLRPGAHMLVASTGIGKTAWQLQLALHAAREGVPVLYIGLELIDLEVVARLIALLEEARPSREGRLEGVKASDMLNGKVSEERLAELITAANKQLGELPLELQTGDAHGWDYTRLVPAVQALRARYELDGDAPVLVVLDYLQLVSSPEGAREDVRERIGRAAYQAREAARRANAAVLVTSSLARSGDKVLGEWGRAWPKERGSDGSGLLDLIGLGKEAGEIEYSADTVIVMARTRPVKGEAFTRVRVGISKLRNGQPGETTLCFNGARWFGDEWRDAARRRIESDDFENVDANGSKSSKRGLKGSTGVDKAAGGW